MSDTLLERLARVMNDHRVGEPMGGTASEAWVTCSCGARISLPGGTRELARSLGEEHQAEALLAVLRNPSDEDVERCGRVIAASKADPKEWRALSEVQREDLGYEERTPFRIGLAAFLGGGEA